MITVYSGAEILDKRIHLFSAFALSSTSMHQNIIIIFYLDIGRGDAKNDGKGTN